MSRCQISSCDHICYDDDNDDNDDDNDPLLIHLFLQLLAIQIKS